MHPVRVVGQSPYSIHEHGMYGGNGINGYVWRTTSKEAGNLKKHLLPQWSFYIQH